MRYAIVYFGRPAVIRRERATRAAAISVAKLAKGTGTCTVARVYECDTVALARTADISEVRHGERVIFEA